MDPVLGALGNPQTLNRYPYVVNNPTRHTDPTGEFVGALLAFLIFGFAVPMTVVGVVTGDLDAVMMAIGTIPILGDLLATPYFLVKDLNACFGWWEDERTECSPGMVGLDAVGFLPFVPALGAAAHLGRAGRATSRVDDLVPPGGIFGTTLRKLPMTGMPNSVMRQLDSAGNLRSLGSYDDFGRMFRRIDVSGRPHFIPGRGYTLPHATDFVWNPGGRLEGWGFRTLDPRPTTYWENFLIRTYR